MSAPKIRLETERDQHSICMAALIESQAVIQLIDEKYGGLDQDALERDESLRVVYAVRLARRRLDEAVDAFFGGK